MFYDVELFWDRRVDVCRKTILFYCCVCTLEKFYLSIYLSILETFFKKSVFGHFENFLPDQSRGASFDWILAFFCCLK